MVRCSVAQLSCAACAALWSWEGLLLACSADCVVWVRFSAEADQQQDELTLSWWLHTMVVMAADACIPFCSAPAPQPCHPQRAL